MCKVFMVSGIKPETVENAWVFAQEMGKLMSKGNSDGLGYAAITNEGKLFGERWLENKDAFAEAIVDTTPFDDELFANLGEAIDGSKKEFNKNKGEYNNFGKFEPDKIVALTLHTRFATSPKGMQNTHPFVDNNVSLIHNGVIRNPEAYGMKNSSCDSESILQGYLKEDVVSDPANFQKVAEKLQGYYACGVLTNSETGPILDIFKGNSARLYAAFIKELNAFVLSTDDDDIKNTAKYLGFTMGEVYKINEGRFIRVNAITGKTASITSFKVGETGYYSGNHYSSRGSYNSPTNTSQKSTTGDTGNSAINKDNVYPFGKSKDTTKNPTLQKALVPYYTAGKLTCTRLSEREEQEVIAKYERLSM